ncbi:glycoside hydrolase family protein [Serratia sp. OS31]|nr:glycoside hydrolase family protein [Serratia sp. OS31]
MNRDFFIGTSSVQGSHYHAGILFLNGAGFWGRVSGYLTIGYGHLVLANENYSQGLTEQQADALLLNDIAIARRGVESLKLNLPSDSRWNDFLVMMVFQLGLTKTRGFKRFLAALSNKNYATAILEVKDSQWYRQTPSRVDSMIAYVVRG